MDTMPPKLDFRALIDGAPDPYLILDPQLVIVAVTDAYLRATKTRREEILGRGIFSVFPDNPDDPAAEGVRNLRASLLRALKSKTPDAMPVQKYDIRKPESEGGGFEEHYWSPINTPILDSDGEVRYLIHRVEDVTEFVRLKLQGVEQSRVNESLKARAVAMETEIFARSREVAAASAELKSANEELERLYRRTLELEQLKSQFFANVSHELRTPLTLIMGPLEKRLRCDLSPEERRETDLMLRNARLLYRHVTDLLDAAKLESGRMGMQWSKLDLAKTVRAIASNFESLAADRGIAYRVSVPPALAGEADNEKLQRILLNLLSNAFKFTPAGGRVCVSLETTDGKPCIRVEDNGPGVPLNMRTAIFERFRQLEGGADRSFGGTGLGLSIVKDFVDMHGGSIQVSEADGGGACFRVTLPSGAPAGAKIVGARGLAAPMMAEAVEELAARGKVRSPLRQEPDGAAPLVLIVEDNPDMNDYLGEILSVRYRVANAADGRIGLEMARRLRPDMLITDVMMPHMSGDEMVTVIRRDKTMDDMPIIMLTAREETALSTRMRGIGVQSYLGKPFDSDELLARVQRLLTDRKRVQEDLRRRDSRYRAVVETSSDGFLAGTPAGRITEVNESLIRLTGYSREELLDMDFVSLDALPDVAGNRRLLDQIMVDGQRRFEAGFRRKDGEVVPVEISASYRSDEGFLFGFVRDITEHKRDEARIAEYVRQLESMTEGTLLAISNMVEKRDPYTAGHERRVAAIASDIAMTMGEDAQTCKRIYYAGLVHDIGKIAIPSDILTKPRRLSAMEYALVKEHADEGYEILKGVRFPFPLADIIHQHHERLDGSGYPLGLQGEAILPEARILAVADVVESISSHRPYRPALGIDVAIRELAQGQGRLYDAVVVDAFVGMVRDKGYQLPN